MALEIRELARADEADAIRFAIEGMHLSWFVDTPVLLAAYGRYFWYEELARATQVIAAYEGGRLAGVLLAAMAGEVPARPSHARAVYVRLVRGAINALYRGSEDAYDEANARMYAAYVQGGEPDGELCFLAADPQATTRGIGTALLAELACREPGKKIFLFTDSGCTYQFYEHRGFERAAEKRVELDLGGRVRPLTCYLYSKVL